MARLEKSHTLLKCKPCKKFYDEGTVCEECGEDLREITVWNLKPSSVTVNPCATSPGGSNDKH